MREKHNQWVSWALVFTWLLPGKMWADVYLKQKHHVDGFTVMGNVQPQKDYIGSMWITENKARSDIAEDQSVIIRLDKKCLYVLNHNEKSVMEIPLEEVASPSKKAEEDISQLPQEVQKMMKPKIQIQETGETKVIHGWACRKYIQTVEMGMGPSTTTEIWASTEVKLDVQLFSKFNSAMMALNSMMRGIVKDMGKETQKIKGVAVLTETTSMIMNQKIKSSMELLEVKTGTAPSGIFDIPSGYKMKKWGEGRGVLSF